ncbi:MAG: hypothetical protein GY930_14385 [bacterium]|nr:hypothetical protein [bacterium]
MHFTLNATLFVAFPGAAKRCLNSIVSLELSKGILPLAVPSLKHLADRRGQVVKPQIAEDPSIEFQGLHQALEQRFSRFVWRLAGVATA